MGGIKSNYGETLRKQHGIRALQVRYHLKGDFFMPIEKFPGVLADPNGYVLFETEQGFVNSPHLHHRGSSKNPRVGVPGEIVKLSGYVKFKNKGNSN